MLTLTSLLFIYYINISKEERMDMAREKAKDNPCLTLVNVMMLVSQTKKIVMVFFVNLH